MKNKDNLTPLLCAVRKGQGKVVKYLLKHGANIFITDVNDKSALHLAIEDNCLHIIDLLIKKGGKKLLNATDKDFKTPMHSAAAVGNDKVNPI